MSNHKRIIGITVIAAMLASVAGAGLAAQSAADQITARRAFMKSLGATMGAARGGDKAAAQKLVDGFKAFGTQFPAGSDGAAGATRAKAEVWSDAAGFKAQNDKAIAAAQAMLAAPDAAGAAAAAAGINCAACHTPYRGPAV